MINKQQILTCHPATPCPFPIQLSSHTHFLADGTLQLHYTLQGNVDNISLPLQRLPTQTDNLWQHTCFEAFISTKQTTAYYEYNFSPSQQWAVYAFETYRQPIPHHPQDIPSIKVTQTPHQLILKATLAPALLPYSEDNKSLQLGLTAIIEHHDHSLSYWALNHPLATPDFHHRKGFIHTLKR
jgi:hypothetical protein